MRIASVEHVELVNIMELSVMGQVLKCARQMNPSGGLLLCRAVGWNMRSHSRLMAARRLRVKTHTRKLIVTMREAEERGICRATLEGLLRIVTDQLEEGSVVLIVLSQESAICRKASMKTLSHDVQPKYVDVGETSVVTNSRCIAEQFKSDRVDKVAMDGPTVVEDDVMDGKRIVNFGKVLENVVMDGPKVERPRKVVENVLMD